MISYQSHRDFISAKQQKKLESHDYRKRSQAFGIILEKTTVTFVNKRAIKLKQQLHVVFLEKS